MVWKHSSVAGVSKVFEMGARFHMAKLIGANLGGTFLHRAIICIQTNFNKPFCVSYLHFYCNLITYILYDRGCGPDEI